MHELKETDSKTFFHKPIEQFVCKGFGNLWQLAIYIIHETLNMTVCNSRQASLGSTII
jgi:hypothetical protein